MSKHSIPSSLTMFTIVPANLPNSPAQGRGDHAMLLDNHSTFGFRANGARADFPALPPTQHISRRNSRAIGLRPNDLIN